MTRTEDESDHLVELARAGIIMLALALEAGLYLDAATGGKLVRAVSDWIAARRRRSIMARSVIDAEALAAEARVYLSWWERRKEVRGDGG